MNTRFFIYLFLFILFGYALNITEILFAGSFSPEISAHTKTPKNEIIDKDNNIHITLTEYTHKKHRHGVPRRYFIIIYSVFNLRRLYSHLKGYQSKTSKSGSGRFVFEAELICHHGYKFRIRWLTATALHCAAEIFRKKFLIAALPSRFDRMANCPFNA